VASLDPPQAAMDRGIVTGRSFLQGSAGCENDTLYLSLQFRPMVC
jgi:hypothetical protein